MQTGVVQVDNIKPSGEEAMKKRIILCFLLVMLIVFTACANDDPEPGVVTPGISERRSEPPVIESETVEPSVTESEAAEPHAEILTPPETSEKELPTAEALMARIDESQFIWDKVQAAQEIYIEYPEIGLPVIKDFINNIDFNVELIGELILSDLDKLLITLYNGGESAFVEETIARCLDSTAIDDSPWLYGLLADRDTYVATAQIVLTHGRIANKDVEALTWGEIVRYAYDGYMAYAGTLDDELSAAKTIASEVYPLLPEDAANDDAYPYMYNAIGETAYRNFATQMPSLSTGSQVVPDGTKCLVVFRNDKEGDITDWYIAMDFMAALPAELIPESLSEVNVLIAIDTYWEYANDYSITGGKIVKGYKAVSSISAYDFETGAHVDSLGEIVTPIPFSYFFSGEPPEKLYVSIDGALKRCEFATLISDYLYR